MAGDGSSSEQAGFWSRLVSAPRRWSLPTQAAVVVALALVAMVATAWLIFVVDPNSVPWRHAMTWWRITLEVALVVVIPLVVYQALKIWLEGEKSRFPDIDYAWNAGRKALQEHGLPLDAAPLFLVLGATGPRQEQALLAASARSFRVTQIPEGPAALHWYASPDAIFLCCTEVGWLSALAALRAQRGAVAVSSPTLPEEVRSPAPSPTGAAAPSPNVAPEGSPPTGTLMVDQFVARVPAEPQAGSTVQFGAAEPGRTVAVPAAARLGAAAAAREPVALTARDSGEQLERLQYLCRLIRRGRQPVCGLNGVLTLLPVDVLQVPPGEAEEVARALKGDLSTIHDTLQLRTPTIATVAGLEEDRGFRELIRRVGRERAAAQRFGQKFELRRYATQEDMEALSAHVCGTFEDWIYALFREPDALNRPGNTQLYRLLCTVRCHWKTRLANLLSHGCGYDPQRQPDDERCFVSGCYCAATGESSDRQAFVKAVIDKLVEENELVEWTERAWREQRRYRRAAAVGYTLAAVLAGLTVVAVVYQQLS